MEGHVSAHRHAWAVRAHARHGAWHALRVFHLYDERVCGAAVPAAVTLFLTATACGLTIATTLASVTAFTFAFAIATTCVYASAITTSAFTIATFAACRDTTPAVAFAVVW